MLRDARSGEPRGRSSTPSRDDPASSVCISISLLLRAPTCQQMNVGEQRDAQGSKREAVQGFRSG